MRLRKLIKLSFVLLIGLLTLYSCDQLGELLGDEDTGEDSLYVNNFDAILQNGSIILTWDHNNDASRYDIWVADDYNGPFQSLAEVYDNTEYIHENVESNRYYYYQIRIIDYNGNYHEFSQYIQIDTYDYGGGGGGSNQDQEIYDFNNWNYYDIDSGVVQWFYILVQTDDVIQVELDDLDSGQMQNSGNINFSLYYTDKSTMYPGMENLDNTDDTNVQVTIPQGVDRLYIKVDAYTSGSFSLRLNKIVFSSESRLGSIDVNNGMGNFTPQFDMNTLDYVMNISENTSIVDFTLLYGIDYNAVVTATVDGFNVSVNSGALSVNNFSINVSKVLVISVTSSDGSSTSNYTFTITQGSNNSNLSSLVFSQGELDSLFVTADQEYILLVPYAATVVTVTPTAEDAGATITVNGTEVNSGEQSNPVSIISDYTQNGIVVEINAADGSNSKYYNIDIQREASSNFELNMPDAVSIEYDDVDKIYTVATETNLNSTLIEILPEDGTAQISIDGDLVTSAYVSLNGNFVEVSVVVIITPNSGSGTPETYTIKVTPSWTNDSPGDVTELYYGFEALAGNVFTVQWDDLINGSGTYGEDIVVTALRGDQITIITDINSVNSGYSNPLTLTAPVDGVIYLKVRALDGSNVDDFGIRVYSVDYSAWISFKASGDNTIIVR